MKKNGGIWQASIPAKENESPHPPIPLNKHQLTTPPQSVRINRNYQILVHRTIGENQ